MKYLNLSDNFNPFKAPESKIISFNFFIFNGGEPHIVIDVPIRRTSLMVTTRINNSDDLMKLAVAMDVVNNSGAFKSTYLFLPYFPGARQDRRTTEGEPLTAKVYAEIINSMNFDEVIIFDPHSDVTSALVDNCTIITNVDFVSYVINNFLGYTCDEYHLISPDAGASKKISKIADTLGCNIVYGSKHRNIATGALSDFSIESVDLQGKPCVIVDDICDGGGTFIGIAKALKEKKAGDLFLIVSHGIFSQGFKELSKYFEEIYTTDSIRSEFNWEQIERDKTSLCTIIPFNDFIW